MYPIIEIFGRQIGTYSVIALVGMFVSFFTAFFVSKRREKIAYEDYIILCLFTVGGLFLGSHIVFGLTNLRFAKALIDSVIGLDFSTALTIFINMFGGMVFYGGFLGACFGVFLYTKIFKTINRPLAFDMLSIAIPLFHVFGRVGCFFGGCCYGIEWSWGFKITNNTVNPDINGVTRIPVQLIEAGCNLLIFLVILYLFRKGIMEGKLIYVYMLVYPVVRFILEFFRGDEIRGELFALSTSQWISIILFMFSVARLLQMKYSSENSKSAA
ncbi:MAG: prolipoprotein diacylglyceryl transferase [Ruminococcus sp.]|nr:prolipoprotein diacylglyceryl transferase [Ruminococcus sp.]